MTYKKSMNTYKFTHYIHSVAYLGFHFGGGGFKIFLENWGYLMHGAKRHARHALARGVRGHAPPRKFLKMVQFGAF